MAGEKTAFGDAYDAFMRGRNPATFGLTVDELAQSRDRSPGRAYPCSLQPRAPSLSRAIERANHAALTCLPITKNGQSRRARRG